MATRNLAQMLTDFADNSTQAITAQNCRDFVDSLFRIEGYAYTASQVLDIWDVGEGESVPEVLALESGTVLGDWQLSTVDDCLYLDAADVGSKGEYLCVLSVRISQSTGTGLENVLRLQGYADVGGWTTVWQSPDFQVAQNKPRSFFAAFHVTVSPADGNRKFRWQLDASDPSEHLEVLTFEDLRFLMTRIGG